ncbi:MAG: efflux RND transporter periplasmic adaptor subunit [Filomicrobium sp.]
MSVLNKATKEVYWRRTASTLVLVAAAAGLAACDVGFAKQTTEAPVATAPAPVVVDGRRPTIKTVTEWDDYTGRFAAVEHVEVRARVSGYLDAIHFKDGQIVQKGDRLFTIDPRPFEAELKAAEAEIANTQAALEFARKELDRARKLLRRGTTPRRTFEEREAAVRQAEAALLRAQAERDRARLNLQFTEISAPTSGRVDRHMVSVGNLIEGGDNGATILTSIVSLDPIHVVFDVDQNALVRYTRASRDGTRPSSRTTANPVQVGLADDVGFPYSGTMDFVSNQVDRGTGTIRVRAIIENDEFLFTPGLFANVRLLANPSTETMLIPDVAVATDQASRVVWTVEEGKARAKVVKLGPLIDGERVIRSGLAADDVVVTTGLHKVRPGQSVTVRQPVLKTANAASSPSNLSNGANQ